MFIIYSDILGVISICFSENDLDIITLNKSSVGNSIPKLTKLLALNNILQLILRSFNQNLIQLIKI